LRKNTQAGLITTKFLGVLINDLREGETATEWGLAALESLNVPTFDTVLKHRTKIARCRGEGAPYVRLWPNDEAAGLYEDLAKEAIKRLDEMESATHE
jgi:cellulose biosynthesis protein BcsQ